MLPLTHERVSGAHAVCALTRTSVGWSFCKGTASNPGVARRGDAGTPRLLTAVAQNRRPAKASSHPSMSSPIWAIGLVATTLTIDAGGMSSICGSTGPNTALGSITI